MKHVIFTVITMFLGLFMTSAQNETGLLRFPAIYGDQVVFSYAGDLYTVSKAGGVARKLTSHEGYEMFARFSPDGRQLAFTAQYDGNTEVYLMPAQGGIPVRLTHTATLGRDDISDRMGPNNIVITWSQDGQYVIYRSRKQSFNDFTGQLFKVPAAGGLSAELPFPRGGFCSFAPDGNRMAYNRVFREFRTWKYYRGGMADDIWIYDFEQRTTTNITGNEAQDIIPMWYRDRIYFLSDRDRTMNLFVYDLNSGETRKVTQFTDYDIKFPSLGDQAIIFEKGGFLYVMDLDDENITRLNIQIADDFITGRSELKDASKSINSYEIAPDGKRALFWARGDIWTVPAENGITRNLTKSSGVHDRNPVWSPDGKYIAYISDATGEDEVYILRQDASEEPVQLTKKGDTYKYRLVWSPDSKKLLWADKKMRLLYIDIETRNTTEIEQSKIWEFNNYAWSPDSKWIAFCRPTTTGMNTLVLYNLGNEKTYDVTDEWYGSGDPAFSRDGKYLFFTSNRDFDPIYSWVEWNYAYRDMNGLYLVTLAKDTPSPFAPENDEVSIKGDEETIKDESNTESTKDTKSETKDITVDTEGMNHRILALPVPAGNYWGIQNVGDKIYYNYRSSGDKTTMKLFDLKAKKETDLGFEGGFEVSADGKKALLHKGSSYYIIDLPSGPIKTEKSLDLSNMKARVDYKQEWEQIFKESWRQMRDFFYVVNMHGVNWDAMYEKYHVLLPYVNNRNDLNYLIGEMIGELSVGHAYISGGDKPSPVRIKMGLLGAELARDGSGYFRIERILEGQNWSKDLRSPLTEIGVDVSEGDFILAVNGQSTQEMNDMYETLIGTAGNQVELTVNSTPSNEGSRKVIVVPISDESSLYYYNWVHENIRKVNEATNGEVGYIHIPDMGPGGLNEFVKYFYPQLNKKGLIIDDRGNGGGNVSPMIIERLSREMTRSNMARNVLIPGQTPRQMMRGPMVLLINEYSASDGDLFPYAFKKHGLGTLIGKRTWGGVVGIRGSLPFIDGGDLRKPEFASYSADESEWIIEGIGVEPDIIVDNDPAREFDGIDDQLNKAIEVILEELKNYKEIPGIPDPPNKSR